MEIKKNISKAYAFTVRLIIINNESIWTILWLFMLELFVRVFWLHGCISQKS
jgi:hypothetical protein